MGRARPPDHRSRFLIPRKRLLPFRDAKGAVNVHMLRRCLVDVAAGSVHCDESVVCKLRAWHRHAARWMLSTDESLTLDQLLAEAEDEAAAAAAAAAMAATAPAPVFMRLPSLRPSTLKLAFALSVTRPLSSATTSSALMLSSERRSAAWVCTATRTASSTGPTPRPPPPPPPTRAPDPPTRARQRAAAVGAVEAVGPLLREEPLAGHALRQPKVAAALQPATSTAAQHTHSSAQPGAQRGRAAVA